MLFLLPYSSIVYHDDDDDKIHYDIDTVILNLIHNTRHPYPKLRESNVIKLPRYSL